MPLYLPPKTSGTCAIAICDRCKMKHYYDELLPDPNSPGLRVCDGCRDVLDPYRLPARETEPIALRYPRPDVSLPDATESDTIGTEYFENIDFPPEIST